MNMIWRDSDDVCSTDASDTTPQNGFESMKVAEKDDNHEKVLIQLKKCSDPNRDPNRLALLHITDSFHLLVLRKDYNAIDETLLSDDCQMSVYDSEETTRVYRSSKLEGGFGRIYKDMNILHREIIQNFIDVEKGVVIQNCRLALNYTDEENGSKVVEKMSSEIFSIKDHRIYKYRASSALTLQSHGPSCNFAQTHKEKMLARVKELNYKIAGDNPDFHNMASQLDQDTQYKLVSWDGQKSYTCDKNNLVETFDQLEESMKIKRIVPFEMTAQGVSVTASYVYYLEEGDAKKTDEKKTYMWICRCVYIFGGRLNIEKMMQLGELYAEDEVTIPFEAYDKDKVLEKLDQIFHDKKLTFDIFYREDVSFSLPFIKYGPSQGLIIGSFQGLKHMDKLSLIINNQNSDVEWIDPIEVYYDQCDPNYDVIFTIMSGEYTFFEKGFGSKGKTGNGHMCTGFYFENGKLAKTVQFFSELW